MPFFQDLSLELKAFLQNLFQAQIITQLLLLLKVLFWLAAVLFMESLVLRE